MISLEIGRLSPEALEKLMDGPALTPPPGVVPNFDNPPNWNHWGILTNILCLFITLLVIGLRAYAKIICVRKLHIEDYLIVPALATYAGSVYCDFWMIKDDGLFVHQWDIQLKHLGRIIYILHVGSNLCAVTIMILKASILLEWIRIFVPLGSHNRLYWTIMIVLVLHTLFYIGWIILENLTCEPYSKIWDVTVVGGSCIDIKKTYIMAAAVNLLADFIILALPQWTIFTLQMTLKKKMGVFLVFAIGLLACISAAIRLHVSVSFYPSSDIVFAQAGLYLWALAEMTCLFLVFCVPAIPRVFAGNGLKAKVKTMLPWRTKTKKKGSVSISHPLPSVYKQWQGNSRSTDSLGLTTVVIARGHDDDPYQGTTGILRTREFTVTTEKIDLDQETTDVKETEIEEYHNYLRSITTL
ncbi:hypothetical protein E0Z10_g4159 [Xylaria hypoxylon]|uniref:Rhodopsin domain-containing protein n=1 Tax=Xylaria hypoxylon TaxID=37992 RepID=A0A4Z0YK02_9PEZI|nr:hypothetical protein E0Z10_g4159 [Xylaria hypoxylon]